MKSSNQPLTLANTGEDEYPPQVDTQAVAELADQRGGRLRDGCDPFDTFWVEPALDGACLSRVADRRSPR